MVASCKLDSLPNRWLIFHSFLLPYRTSCTYYQYVTSPPRKKMKKISWKIMHNGLERSSLNRIGDRNAEKKQKQIVEHEWTPNQMKRSKKKRQVKNSWAFSKLFLSPLNLPSAPDSIGSKHFLCPRIFHRLFCDKKRIDWEREAKQCWESRALKIPEVLWFLFQTSHNANRFFCEGLVCRRLILRRSILRQEIKFRADST